MEKFDIYFGLIGIACGIYCLYSAYVSKTTGKVNVTLLLDVETRKKPCKDTGAFIMATLPKMIILGITSLIYGGVTLLNYYYVQMDAVMWATLVVFFIILIWFSVTVNKLKKKYY